MSRATPLLLMFLSLFFVAACGLNGPDSNSKFITPSNSNCAKNAVGDKFVVQWKNGATSIEHATSREEFVQNFLEDHKEEIQFAEHDYVVRVSPMEQSEVHAAAEDPADWGQVDTEAEWAWSNNLVGKDVIVGVIDSGADHSHAQLSGQLYTNSREVIDGIDNDDNGYVDDVSGWDFVHWSRTITGDTLHGTHVSGIVLADPLMGPMKGVAPKAKLLSLKFIDGNSGFLSDAIFAIDYAVGIAKRENKPLVINASWGGSDCSLALRTKMDEFNERQVLFAVAAGNGDSRGNGFDISKTPTYPASFALASEVVVAAHTARNFMTQFSNFGIKVNLSAPGLDIYSLAPDGKYARLSGTSMATPFVSGAAAVLWASHPGASTAQIKKAILDGVESAPFNVQTRGKLNIRKAKLALDQM